MAGASVKDAAAEVAARYGLKRRDVYARALELKREGVIMTIETRQAAHRLGHVAEWRAVWRLRLAGYSILARRYKTKLGEIDIVARRGGILAFVEVKARADLQTADRLAGRPAVRPRRARRQPVPGAPSALCRPFGALRCRAGGGLWPRHLPDVWRPPE